MTSIAIASIVIKTGFQTINYNFSRDSTLSKRKNLLESHHVFDVEECDGEMKGKVIRQTSVNAAIKVVIKLTQERAVDESKCKCLTGVTGSCKHIAAVVQFVNEEESITKTSLPQGWGIPSGASKDIYKKGRRIMDLFPPRKKDLHQETETEGLDLGGLIPNCPLLQIIKYEKMNEAQAVCRGIFSDIIVNSVNIVEESRLSKFVSDLVDNQDGYAAYSNDVWRNMSDEQAAIYYSDVFLSKKEIEGVCLKTINQSESTAWFDERSKRVSASIAHKLFERKNLSCDFIADLYNKSSFKSKATTHGLMNEHIAFSEVSELAKVKLVNSGLCIHEKQPWICGSPDGIVMDDEGNESMVIDEQSFANDDDDEPPPKKKKKKKQKKEEEED